MRWDYPDSIVDRAVAFYASGRMIREYTVSCFVKDERVLPLLTERIWMHDERLDDAHGRFSVLLFGQPRRCVFDLATGNIVQLTNMR